MSKIVNYNLTSATTHSTSVNVASTTYTSSSYTNLNANVNVPTNISNKVNNTTYTDKVSFISTNGEINGIQSNVTSNNNNGNFTCVYITSTNSDAVGLKVSYTDTNFNPHQLTQNYVTVTYVNVPVTNDVTATFNFFDSNNVSLGTVVYKYITGKNGGTTITATSTSDSYNYQNLCIYANMGLSTYELLTADIGVQSYYIGVINAMFAINAYPFNMLTTGQP